MRISGTIELDGLYVTFNQGTSQQTTLQAGAPASNITLQLPTTADTLAGLAATQTLTNKTINAANNTISNLTVSMLAAGVLNTSTSLTGATDSQVPSALAAKTYADNVSSAGLATKADKTTTISAGTGLTGGGDLSANRTIALADTAVTLGSYGSATQVAAFTVDQQGRLTAAGNTSIQIAESQVTNLVTDLAGKQAADVDLDALAALATTGLITRTGSGSAATRTITAPAAGITISNGDGVSGNPTLALADDLAALEALSGTGIAVRTASNTWAQRSVAAGTGISVTNGDGVSGNPTVAIDSTVATLTGTQTLTNKTLDNPVIDNAATFVEETTPSNPSAGNYKLYPKNDGSFYVLNSSGVETQIGSGSSGSGTLNIVDNPSATSSTTGWTAATNYTVTRNTSNSPLAGVIDSCFAIVTSATSSETSTSGVYAASLAMPVALRNTKTQVSIYITTPTASTIIWKMSVYNASGTRMSLSSDSSGSTTLPANFNGQFVCTFDADSSATYTISFTQTAGATSSNTLYVTNVSMGNGITAQGAAVSEWQSFTLSSSLANEGTLGNTIAFYRRIGSEMEVRFATEMGTDPGGTLIFTPPVGTLDTSKLNTTSGTRTDLGSAVAFDGNTYYGGNVVYEPATSTTGVIFRGSTGAWGTGTPFTWGANDDFSAEFRIPIAEWAGNGTVNLGQGAAVEYAYNSSTSTTSDTTSFGYGPSGVLFQSFAPAGTAAISKRVRFQYPVQNTDILTVEMAFEASGPWVPLSNYAAYSENDAGSTAYGHDLLRVSGSTTDFDVRFYSRQVPSVAWSSWTARYWRVKKATASAPVGFGLASVANGFGLMAPAKGQYSLTVTSSAAGWSTIRAIGIYYQDQDGNHRLKFNIAGSYTATTGNINLTIAGVTFKNVSGYNQAVTASQATDNAAILRFCHASPNSSIISYRYDTANVGTVYLSEDVELESRPTWA